MKLLAAFTSILITCFSYSQTIDLVPFQINADTPVTSIKVIGHIDHEEQIYSIGNILSIYNSEINLELSEDIDYTVLINNDISMEIKGSEISIYNLELENESDIVSNEPLGMRMSYSASMVEEREELKRLALADNK